jgi:hypothetical protein
MLVRWAGRGGLFTESSIRTALLALVVVGALAVACVLAGRIDVARAGGGFKGDEATYVGLAASAGFDGDLTYGPRDYQRFREWYGSGPQGIFLKRGADGQLYFGKAFLYGVLAAPFALAGGPGGLLVFNFACFALLLSAGYVWLRPGSRRAAALAFTLAFLAASIAPLYAFWLTSDALNFALVFMAFACAVAPPGEPRRALHWRALGFVLLAASIFSKPLNLPLALPLAMAAGRGSVVPTLRALAAVGAAVAAFFAVNAAITGELNYQGGDRKTFYATFPYDESGTTFESAGIKLATDSLAPAGAEGRAASVAANVGYFVMGRHFGLLPFGWPWLVVVGWWAVGERQKTWWQWALLIATAAVGLGTIVWMPYTWSGAGGPVGNRYFLSVAAALFFLTPRVRSFVPAAVAALGLVFVWPSLSSPFTVVKQPWLATRTPIFEALPLELTVASDFPVILDRRRSRIPQGREPTLFVALLDDRSGMGQRGWIAVRPGATSSLLVRSPQQLEGVTVGVKSFSPCEVGLSSSKDNQRIPLGRGDRRDLEMHPSQVFSRDSFVFVLNVDSRSCADPIEVAMQARTGSR